MNMSLLLRIGDSDAGCIETQLSCGTETGLSGDALIKLHVGLGLFEEVPVRHRFGNIVPGGRSTLTRQAAAGASLHAKRPTEHGHQGKRLDSAPGASSAWLRERSA